MTKHEIEEVDDTEGSGGKWP
ncbi:MAG: hypothetical protein QOJ71_1428, partial [Actinomycetota bacterium]|nr:hypothetical protein [Actinomycetota bacterium]